MKVTRATIVGNGIRCLCPNCGGRTIFVEGRMFKVNARCPRCGLRIEAGDGAFLGPFVINYAITAFGLVVPLLVMYASGWLGAASALALSLAAALVAPLALYRLSWGLWLALYYFFLPRDMPANLEGGEPGDE